MADQLQADIVSQAPTGSRGAGTADYRIRFGGGTLELKNNTGTTSFRSLVNKTIDAQGENVAIILTRGQFSDAELGTLGPRIFGASSSKRSIQVVYDTGNGYEMGPSWKR